MSVGVVWAEFVTTSSVSFPHQRRTNRDSIEGATMLRVSRRTE